MKMSGEPLFGSPDIFVEGDLAGATHVTDEDVSRIEVG
jgi:hypothetical protein